MTKADPNLLAEAFEKSRQIDDVLRRLLPVVADSWERLRGCDVYRLLSMVREDLRAAAARRIRFIRQDLASRVDEAIVSLANESDGATAVVAAATPIKMESVHADAGFWRNLGSLVEVMMWANNCGRDGFAGHDSVYGKCHEAIVDMLHAKYPQLTKHQLRNGHGRYGWNEGGNATYLDDVRVMVETLLNEQEQETVVRIAE